MAQDTLSRVNKKMGANRAGLRQKVSEPVLIAWVLLLAYGAFVIWTASITIAEATFTRQLVGIGLGLFLAFLCWRSDFSGLAGMTTVLLVIDLIVLFSPYIPYIPGLSYNAKGMTGWIKIPLIGLTFQPVELAKLITIFFVASLGAQYNGRIDSVREYVKFCAMLMVPFGAAVFAGDLVELAKLITIFFVASLGAQYNGRIDSVREYVKFCAMLMVPFGAAVFAVDLGSGLVIFFAGAAIIMMSGPRKEWVLCTVALIIGLVSIMLALDSVLDGMLGREIFFAGAAIIMMSGPRKEWVLCTVALIIGLVSIMLALDSVLDGMLGRDVLLKQYQMNRLLVFIDPESDTSGAGYNLLCSSSTR